MNIVVILGITTIILVFIAAFIGAGVRKGFLSINAKWHYYIAGIALTLAFIHAIFALNYFINK